MTEIPEGWYLDPTNPEHERLWTGTHWAKGARVAQAGRGAFPGAPDQAAVETAPPRGLNGAADFLRVLAALTAIGALAGGIYLMVHAVDHCVANPYNDAFGTDLQDCSKRHPLAMSGVAVIIGGAIQTAVLAIVAQLCTAVQAMRDAAPTA